MFDRPENSAYQPRPIVQEATPEPHETPENHPENDPVTAKLIRKFEKNGRRRERATIGVVAGILAVKTALGLYAGDVLANKAEAAESTPDIKVVSQEYVQNSRSTTFYLAGFDTPNADIFGKKVGIAIHQINPGEDASIDYGNAPLDVEEIAKKIIEYSKAQELETISIAGNSLGGQVAAKVAEYIIFNSDIEIELVVTNATPDGSDGLRPETQGNLATMIDIFSNYELLELEYSSFARRAFTTAQEYERYLHDGVFSLEDFAATSRSVDERMKNGSVPGMWLAYDQALAVADIDLEETIRAIGSKRGERRMPVFLVLRTKNPNDDKVVLVEQSAKNTCDYAEAVDISCTIALVDGATHTSYQYNTEAFSAAIAPVAEDIRQNIAEEDSYFALMQQGSWETENYTTQK